jgi:hypothetical protein
MIRIGKHIDHQVHPARNKTTLTVIEQAEVLGKDRGACRVTSRGTDFRTESAYFSQTLHGHTKSRSGENICLHIRLFFAYNEGRLAVDYPGSNRLGPVAARGKAVAKATVPGRGRALGEGLWH